MTTALGSLSKNDLTDILNFISDCAAIGMANATVSPFDRIAQLVPVEGVAAIVGEFDGDGRVRLHRVLNISYPAKWIDLYEKRNYSLIDPIVKRHFKTFDTQKWSTTKSLASGQTDHMFWEEASSFGMTAGLTLGIADRRRRRASLFSFHGVHLEEHLRHSIVLEYVMPHLHEAFFRSGLPRAIEVSPVTDREKEILRWLKWGKTNWEIAQILSISERTVKFHLTNLADKLGARSRSHILAVALSYGFIEF